ncbi:MAG: isoaspartyl peptidase/L-asparaginase family protein [Candidatus Hodarchaeota archaeon]
MKYSVVVHGGAGTVTPERFKEAKKGIMSALQTASSLLAEGRSAIAAVEESVKIMEDNPNFNAGKGSTLTIDGQVQMGACIMDGKTLDVGAVALVSNVRYPISLARLVMRATDHILITSDFAEHLAKKFNMEISDPLTNKSTERWKQLRKRFMKEELGYLKRNSKLLKQFPDLVQLGTVGAVAMDNDNNVAAATSTGGITLKLPNRIGDTPQVGCGTYADNISGAVSATGIGEAIARVCLAKTVCCLIENGKSAQKAANKAIEILSLRIGTGTGGCIVVDKDGNTGISHNTKNLVWARMTHKMKKPEVGIDYPST